MQPKKHAWTLLNETRNFLQLYHHHCGTTEVPAAYHTWSCMALLAACAGDRLFFEKMPGDKMCANMYTILLGPSAIGKGVAINKATKFVQPFTDVINVYQGKATAPYLIEEFSGSARTQGEEKDTKIEIDNPSIFLITPELSMSVGSGMIADSFIKFMTALYEGGDYVFREGTRTKGHFEFKNPSINWLAGTTKEWMAECVPRSAVESGFLGRTVVIQAEYSLHKRIPRPSVPPDCQLIKDYIKKKVEWLLRLEGQFKMSNRAWDLKDRWYTSRPAPQDETLIPSWKRQDDLVIKVAMLLAMSELLMSKSPVLVIKQRNVKDAIALVTDAQKCLPRLITYSAQKQQKMDAYSLIEKQIEKAGGIQHTALLRYLGKRAVNAEEAWKALKRLKQEGVITSGGNPIRHEWVGGREIAE